MTLGEIIVGFLSLENIYWICYPTPIIKQNYKSIHGENASFSSADKT